MRTGFRIIRSPILGILAGLVSLAALVAIAWGFLELAEIGTCAQGGPFEIARPCSDETGRTVAVLIGGILAYIVALFLLAVNKPAAAIFLFGLLFTVLGACFIYAELNDARFGGNLGGTGWICGPIFILFMGLPPMYIGIRGWVAMRRRAKRSRGPGI